MGLVLVVEDDESIHSLLEIILIEDGYRVKITRNGQEALDYLAQTEEQPVLILLDLTMPVMNGQEFLKRLKLREDKPGIPVILMTASRQKLAEEVEGAIVDYLPKPFELDELLERVERFTRLHNEAASD